MTVHRRVTNNDENANSNEENEKNTGVLQSENTPSKKASLEIGNTSSCDATMEGDEDEDDMDVMDDLVDDLQRDVESLLSHPPSNKKHGCCEHPYKIGNCIVLCPSLYARFGVGIVGKIYGIYSMY